MNYRTKNKIIEQICKGKPLFIKDTGVQIEVEYFGTDAIDYRRSETHYCNVSIIGTPNTRALKLFEKFHIKKNTHSKEMELDGTINIKHLSLTPYETKAAKVLYEKKKSSK